MPEFAAVPPKVSIIDLSSSESDSGDTSDSDDNAAEVDGNATAATNVVNERPKKKKKFAAVPPKVSIIDLSSSESDSGDTSDSDDNAAEVDGNATAATNVANERPKKKKKFAAVPPKVSLLDLSSSESDFGDTSDSDDNAAEFDGNATAATNVVNERPKKKKKKIDESLANVVLPPGFLDPLPLKDRSFSSSAPLDSAVPAPSASKEHASLNVYDNSKKFSKVGDNEGTGPSSGMDYTTPPQNSPREQTSPTHVPGIQELPSPDLQVPDTGTPASTSRASPQPGSQIGMDYTTPPQNSPREQTSPTHFPGIQELPSPDLQVPDSGTTASTSRVSPQPGSQIGDQRIKIVPCGDSFDPSTEPIRQVTRVFKRHYDGPYATFAQVPVRVRDLWFKEWSKLYRWAPEHSTLVRQNWEKVCKNKLRDGLHRAHKDQTEHIPPYWIAPKDWAQLWAYWRSDRWQRTSASAKRNRASGPSSIHTGGSIPFSEIERRMRREEGDGFRFRNLYKRTHTYKSGPNQGQFTSDQSQQTLEKVNLLAERYTQLKSTDSAHPSVPDDKELFVQAAGGFKKGLVSGLGSESARVRRRLDHATCSSQSTPSASSDPVDVTQMGAKIQQRVDAEVGKIKKTMSRKIDILKGRFSDHILELMRARDKSMQQYLNQMALQMGFPSPPVLPQIPKHGIFQDEDDEDELNFTVSPTDDHPSPSHGFNPPPPPPPSAPAPPGIAT